MSSHLDGKEYSVKTTSTTVGGVMPSATNPNGTAIAVVVGKTIPVNVRNNFTATDLASLNLSDAALRILGLGF